MIPNSDVQRVCIFGAPLDTGNHGVTALGLSIVSKLSRYVPDIEQVLFDNGQSVRPLDLRIGRGSVRIECRGGRISRRLYRRESLWAMNLASMFGARLNDNVRVIDSASAVLDISGGDSFTDIYGRKQLALVTLPKLIALRRRRPLVLLPQTYGPFSDRRRVRMATEVLGQATLAWARDARSFERLRALLGPRFDPDRHRLGVDVAFALPSTDPGERLGNVRDWFDDDHPTVGLNISGLLYNSPSAAMRRFGLAADFSVAMNDLVRIILDRTNCRIVLVAHVSGEDGEADDIAVDSVLSRAGDDERVRRLPRGLRADEIKYAIGRLDWFAGGRMHSTIAALSSRTPAAAFAYSDKFQGVFEGCGVGHAVIDAREHGSRDLAEAAFSVWQSREDDAASLARHLPVLEERLEEQFRELTNLLDAAKV